MNIKNNAHKIKILAFEMNILGQCTHSQRHFGNLPICQIWLHLCFTKSIHNPIQRNTDSVQISYLFGFMKLILSTSVSSSCIWASLTSSLLGLYSKCVVATTNSCAGNNLGANFATIPTLSLSNSRTLFWRNSTVVCSTKLRISSL